MSEVKRLNVADEKFSGKKALGFSLVRLSNILAGLMAGEITYFSTNSLGLAIAAISAGLAAKTAIDAVTDLIMGAIVDGTHTKFGKARPWILAGIPMWLSLVALFLAPRAAMSDGALVAYITVLATLESAVFSTMISIAYETHIKRAIVKEDNRIKTLTIVGVVFAIGSLGLQVALPALINAFHGSQSGFVIMALVTAVIGIAGILICFFICPEYSEEDLAAYGGYDVKEAKEKVSVGVFLKSLLKNKYLFMYTLINFFYMLILMSSFTIGQYYFQYVFGNLGTFSLVLAASAGMMPIYIFIPKLCKKYGVSKVIMVSMIIAAAGVILRMFLPHMLVIQMVGYLCASLPNVFIACVGSQINYQCMEYGQYKTGVVAEGMYSAFISFAQKMATSLSSLLIGLILAAGGFDVLTQAVTKNGFTDWAELSALGTAGYEQYVEGGAAAVTKALSGISFAYNWVPLIFLALDIVLFAFFHLDRDLKKLRVEHGLNEDGSLKEDAEA
ncbi:MAG: MFS transporter [Lachnospiraceae bacterium]|nr:MFS transporter [Lachnospiraceae bacterium]